ncbi:YkvA family protein [Spirillospora sp. NPDC047279]|uniref:YkvA family protein n=1 Tax=Spirillospora sp. NPDC047279 TaxID=3155478 RepID=UPI0034046EA6
MVWLGLPLLVAGTLVLVATDHALAGAAIAIAGGVLVIAGVLRLRRAARRTRTAPGGRGGTAVDAYYRTSTGKVIAMIAAVVYIISPIDLIPDPLLPFGIVDDATALGWLAIAFGQEYGRRRRAGVSRD